MRAKMRVQDIDGVQAYTNYSGEDAEYPVCNGDIGKTQMLFLARPHESWHDLAVRFKDKEQYRLVRISPKLANAGKFGARRGVVVTYPGGLGYK